VTAPSISEQRRESWIWRLDTPAGLAVMFAVALGIRLAIAPYAGFYGDLRLFQLWATRLAEVGPRHFYVKGQFADYPPGYLYVLWVIGKISSPPGYLLMKLPALVADLGAAWIAGTFAARLAPASLKERLPVRGVVAAAVLFNPAVIALSAVWGQVDVVPATAVLWSLFLLFTGRQTLQREIAAFLLFAVAIAMKPQTGFVLPVMLYALYRRYLHRRSSQEIVDGLLAIALTGALSLGLWLVSGLAFGLGPVKLFHFYRDSSNVYPVTSANAFNLWGALGFWRHDSAGGQVMTLFGISALHVGFLLFIAGIVLILWQAHRAIEAGANEGRVLTVSAAVVALLGYVVLTRMHERYMFYALVGLAPVIFVRQLRLAYAGLSALFILNLWFPYAYFNAGWTSSGVHVDDLRVEPWFRWLVGGFGQDAWQKKVWSLAIVVVAVVLVLRAVRWIDPARAEPVFRWPSVDLRGRWRVLRDDAEPGSRIWPLAVVALACVFGLIALRGETNATSNLNDTGFHLQMVRWADGQLGEGRLPLDGWYPYLSLGSSQFHHYQSLPHTLTAITARATGAGDQTAYDWYLYLLLALWPIAVYFSARLLGLGRWPSAAAAAVAPLLVSAPGYGYEDGSYTWQGYGVYSQLWAMWTLPLAWGFTWRAVSQGKRYAAAAAALAVTMAFHFITGYLAVLTVGVWVLVATGASFWRRAGRAALVVGSSMLVASWVLVPLIGDTKWTNQSEYYTGSIFNDSYGARKILGWLFHGALFDNGRFPIVTLLFFAGLLVCLARVRTDVRARALLGAFTLSLLVFFGRPTIGPILGLFPGFSDVQIHRFIMGVHLAGILIAGVGLAWLLRAVFRLFREIRPHPAPLHPVAIAALVVAILAPAWVKVAEYNAQGATWIRQQQAADRTDGRDLDRLVAIVKQRGGGRVYAGLRGNWGKQYRVGSVPVHIWLANRNVDAIGFTFRTIASLSTDVEAAFDETDPAQYQMLNVRYLILPFDHPPPVPAKLIASAGRHRLYEVPTTGYLQVVDRSSPIAANRTDVEQATRSWRESQLVSQAIYPGIGWDGAQGPLPTFGGARPPAGSPGRVLTQSSKLQDGVFAGTVDASRTAVVLLKATYDPRWTATVDGRSVKPVMMAPSLVGVEVPPGRHEVRFKYRPYGGYPVLLAIGALTLLGLAAFPRRAALKSRFTAAALRGRRARTTATGRAVEEPR
jgi:Gpi18-like mannosyltransferase